MTDLSGSASHSDDSEIIRERDYLRIKQELDIIKNNVVEIDNNKKELLKKYIATHMIKDDKLTTEAQTFRCFIQKISKSKIKKNDVKNLMTIALGYKTKKNPCTLYIGLGFKKESLEAFIKGNKI